MFFCTTKGSQLSTGSPTLHMRPTLLRKQTFGLGNFMVWTIRVAGKSIQSGMNLLMKRLAIWLSWQTTQTKPWVMHNAGEGSGDARALGPRSGQQRVCTGRCAAASPAPKPLATISVAMYTNWLRLKTDPKEVKACRVKRKALLNCRCILFGHTGLCYAYQ